ncbi:hypothetical protein LWI28_002063 [Acer negundo]|uniref:Uncharacterized protein n=1 Tax=Acer negundo TaxID=4023 RepID=A0AAD5J2C6_ACENE|nr:hypothetical protein LWI28_002063 [Acer negundo]
MNSRYSFFIGLASQATNADSVPRAALDVANVDVFRSRMLRTQEENWREISFCFSEADVANISRSTCFSDLRNLRNSLRLRNVELYSKTPGLWGQAEEPWPSSEPPPLIVN